jgi:hypothetical protein
MDLLSIRFERVVQELSGRCFVTNLEAIAAKMSLMMKMMRILGVYRMVRAGEPARTFVRVRDTTLTNIWEFPFRADENLDIPRFDHQCEQIISWLGDKFPILEDATFMDWTDPGQNNTLIYLANPGIDLSWDEATEVVEIPANWSKEWGLMFLALYAAFFVQLVSEDSDLQDFWDSANRWFGWNADAPWWLWLPDHEWSIDNVKLYRRLAESGLAGFADTFREAWHDTGLFFLDLETQCDYYGMGDNIVELTVANIHKYTRLWQEARPLHERSTRACKRAFEHPELYQTAIEILGGCIAPADKKTSPEELRERAAIRRQSALEGSRREEVEEDDDQH